MAEKIIYTYVVADLLHTGHILYLENAKALGGEDAKLIVGVLTDDAVMEKKPRPIISFNERLRLIKALKCVDAAVPQGTYSPIQNIKNIKPDLLVESASHSEKDLHETKSVMDSLGGHVLILPYYPEQSSTKIKEEVTKNLKDSNNSGEQDKNKTNFLK